MSKKILVIDDEADVRTYLSRLLQKYGYETVTAEDGVAGLEVARLYGDVDGRPYDRGTRMMATVGRRA